MEKITLTACSNARCDAYIAQFAPNITRSFAKKLFESGAITVNGKNVKASCKLNIGDEIAIELPEVQTLEARAQNIPLDIVYEDSDVLIINKPRGMVVHPAAGNFDGTLVNALMHHCGDNLSAINGVIRPGIVHRIDKDTTGLLAVAKNNAAHLALARQLVDRSLSRTYYAIVHGNVKEDSGTIDAPIDRNPKDRKKMAVVSGGRSAITHFTVLERFSKYTYMCYKLQTGRTHQIRVHTAYTHHPILGDRLYGLSKEEYNLQGQLLHAGKIGFIHPSSGKRLEFSAPLPDDFNAILEKIRQKYI